jgi:hypothetical protein
VKNRISTLIALLIVTIASSQAHAYCTPGANGKTICGEGPKGGFATGNYKIVTPTGGTNKKGNPAYSTTHYSGGKATKTNRGWK